MLPHGLIAIRYAAIRKYFTEAKKNDSCHVVVLVFLLDIKEVRVESGKAR